MATKYNQKLATICQQLQVIDKNGFYSELYQEYTNNEITLSEAMQELKEVVNNMLTDNPSNNQLQSILDYINF